MRARKRREWTHSQGGQLTAKASPKHSPSSSLQGFSRAWHERLRYLGTLQYSQASSTQAEAPRGRSRSGARVRRCAPSCEMPPATPPSSPPSTCLAWPPPPPASVSADAAPPIAHAGSSYLFASLHRASMVNAYLSWPWAALCRARCPPS